MDTAYNFGAYEDQIIYIAAKKSYFRTMETTSAKNVGPLPPSHISVGKGGGNFGAHRGPTLMEEVVSIEHKKL